MPGDVRDGSSGGALHEQRGDVAGPAVPREPEGDGRGRHASESGEVGLRQLPVGQVSSEEGGAIHASQFSELNHGVNTLNQRQVIAAEMTLTDQEVEEARAHLNAWVRYHIWAEGCTQEAFATRLGLTKGVITQWFTGTGTKSLPSFTSFLAISKELGVPLDVLIHGKPPRRRDPPTPK